jgi:Flp pilus assembly protein TadG
VRHNGGKAQSLVEFALVMPLLLLLVFALIDFSRLLFTYVSLTNGTREVARTVSLSGAWGNLHAATDTTNIVNSFNNLSIFAGAPSGATNATLTVGSGTITCSSMTSSGCGMRFTIDWANSTISFDESGVTVPASGTASTSITTGAMPLFSSFNPSANGDYVALMQLEEGVSQSNTSIGYLQICPLPLTTSCALSNLYIWNGGGGMVEVDVSYAFHYNPLFQNKLSGVIDASFMRQVSVLTTTTRTTSE